MNIPHRTVIDIAGPYDAKSIYALISAETTLTGVRLAFDGLLAQAMSAPLGVNSHAALVEAAKEALAALNMMIDPASIQATTASSGFSACTAAAAKVRAVLQLAEPKP